MNEKEGEITVEKSNLIVNILLSIFVLRPIIDLAWENTNFLGLNLAGVIAVIIIILSVFHFLYSKRLPFNNTVQTGMLYIFYIGIVTLINFTNFSDFDYLLRIMSAFAFLIVVAPNISIKKLNICITLFIITTLVPIFLTYMQVLGIIPYTYFDYVDGMQISRGSGGYRQPSVLTRFCTIALLYSFYLMENITDRKKKILLITYICLNLLAVVLSYHRTGYLIVIIGSFIWFYTKNRKKTLKLLTNILVATLIGAFVILFAINLNWIALDISTFQSMFSLSNIFIVSETGNIELVLRGRGDILNFLFYSFKENPWYSLVFGNGVNVNAVTGLSMKTADMEFIRVLWNVGILGGVLWILHFSSMKKSISSWKNKHGKENVYRLATCLFWIFIVWGFTIEATGSPNLMYHVYLICGICCYKNILSEEK